MANIIKKISGVDLSGNTVIADAAVTNMYTDENGDLNIKTSTELGDTDDSKVVITSKEINLNADTVKINNTPLDASEIVNNFNILSDFTRDVEYAVTNHSARIDNIETSVSTLQDDVTTLTENVNNLSDKCVELTEYMHEGAVLPNASVYTYNNTVISQYFASSPGFGQYIVFKVHMQYIIFIANIVTGSTPGSVPQINGYRYAGTTTINFSEGSEEESLYNLYIKSCNGDTVPGEQSYVYSDSKGLMTLEEKQLVAQIKESNFQDQLNSINEYLDQVESRLSALES